MLANPIASQMSVMRSSLIGGLVANLATNLKGIVGHTLWIEQLKAMGLTIVLSLVATAILAYLIKFLIGLRPDDETENEGLDLSEHGETGYHYPEG